MNAYRSAVDRARSWARFMRTIVGAGTATVEDVRRCRECIRMHSREAELVRKWMNGRMSAGKQVK